MSVYSIKNGKVCPCCLKSPNMVVKGINDVATVAPWLGKMFENEEDAYTHTVWSSDKVNMVCPDCKDLKYNIRISDTYKYKHLSCPCRDEISMPNKISFFTLKSIDYLIENYKREYSPSWADKFRYDNYFEYEGEKFIIEMDGNIGHGNYKYKSQEIDKVGIESDKKKNQLAKEHNINLFRVDCKDPNYHIVFMNLIKILKEDILKREVDFDENEIMMSSSKNFIKLVCDFYSKNKNILLKDISSNFNIQLGTLQKYLKFGNQYKWCEYITMQEKRIDSKEEAIKLWNDKKSIFEISGILNICKTTIVKYLNEGHEDGICDYDSQKELECARKKGVAAMIKTTSKKVYVYDSNNKLLNVHESVSQLERESLEKYGEEFKSRCVGRVCLGQRKTYKGYVFSYVPLNNKD